MKLDKIIGIVLLPLFLLTTACEKPAEVVIHEPGQYKGKVDPLLKKTPELEKSLRDRIKQVQTDR